MLTMARDADDDGTQDAVKQRDACVAANSNGRIRRSLGRDKIHVKGQTEHEVQKSTYLVV